VASDEGVIVSGIEGEVDPTHEVDEDDVVVMQEDDVEPGEPEVVAEREAIVASEMGRGMRNKVSNIKLKDFVTHTFRKVKSSESSSAQINLRKP